MTPTATTARAATGIRRIDPRIARRRQEVSQEHGRRRRRIWAAILAVGAVAVAGSAALFSPLLDVDEVVVIGAEALGPPDVTAVGRIARGDPMILVDEGKVADLLGEDPRVDRVAIRRRWPGTVEIRVTERVASLRLVSDQGSVLVSADGVVVDGDDPPETFGVWDLRMDSLSDTAPGERIPEDLRPVVEIAASLPRRVAIAVKAMSVDDFGDLHLDIGEGRDVTFGPPEQASHKFTAIITMLGGRVDTEGLCRLDVSDPFAPRITRSPGCGAAGPAGVDDVEVEPSDAPDGEPEAVDATVPDDLSEEPPEE